MNPFSHSNDFSTRTPYDSNRVSSVRATNVDPKSCIISGFGLNVDPPYLKKWVDTAFPSCVYSLGKFQKRPAIRISSLSAEVTVSLIKGKKTVRAGLRRLLVVPDSTGFNAFVDVENVRPLAQIMSNKSPEIKRALTKKKITEPLSIISEIPQNPAEISTMNAAVSQQNSPRARDQEKKQTQPKSNPVNLKNKSERISRNSDKKRKQSNMTTKENFKKLSKINEHFPSKPPKGGKKSK